MIISHLIREAVRLWEVGEAELRGDSRQRRVVQPRMAVMFVATKVLGISTTRVGRAIGGRDHTTVMSGCKRVPDLAQHLPDFRHRLEHLKRFALELPPDGYTAGNAGAAAHSSRQGALERAAGAAIERLMNLHAYNPDAFDRVIAGAIGGEPVELDDAVSQQPRLI